LTYRINRYIRQGEALWGAKKLEEFRGALAAPPPADLFRYAVGQV
jgi:hypothetical protein